VLAANANNSVRAAASVAAVTEPVSAALANIGLYIMYHES
jgi:hypothetical protein